MCALLLHESMDPFYRNINVLSDGAVLNPARRMRALLAVRGARCRRHRHFGC